jgi:hypothetical protein
MPNQSDTVRMLAFMALAAFLVGAVAATVIASVPQADAQPETLQPICPPNSPNAGQPVNPLEGPTGCGPGVEDPGPLN